MNTQKTLIDELENAVAQKEIGERANVLQRITDLFVVGSIQLSDEQVTLFDDVMARLVRDVDFKARALVAQRLSEMATAPPGVIRELALDDSIEVAGPVLARSERISEEVLVEGVMTKSQDHLFAISQRRSLSECVTDVLVERGDSRVAINTANNLGARFSDFGYSTLVKRSEAYTDLAASVWKRPEVPRRHLLALFAAASEAVRQELQSINSRKTEEIRDLVALAGNELQSLSREQSSEYAAARSHVQSLHDSKGLCELNVLAFARARKFQETAIALSLIGDFSIGMVERAMAHDKCDQLLVLAKSIGLSFETVKAILMLQTGMGKGLGPDLKEARESFGKLRAGTARTAVQYYRLRERVLN
jgi:uncharacterized protein (DUF2336 family)